MPIGINSDGNFRNATFDGNDYTISGLAINRASSSDVGLFSILNNATIRNLKLTNISITGNDNVGALVGRATGTTTLSNIELIGDESQTEITSNGSNVGGLVGSFAGTITDASSSLTVRRHNRNTVANTGGLVGRLTGGSIKNSNSSGFVSNSGPNAGGLVGNNGGNISNSWASGGVTQNGRINNQYGGLVGHNDSGTISNSWASGEIRGASSLGGLVGQNDSGTISNSWASGEVTTGGGGAGGLVGVNESGTIRNSWASGEVIGSAVGGLVGGLFPGTIHGRNYQLDDATGTATIGANSFILDSTAELARLSGDASGGAGNADSYGTHSQWHAGFNAVNTQANLLTRFCDTNGNGMIDDGMDTRYPINEQVATNSVWVMPSEPTTDFPTGISDNVPATMSPTESNSD